VVDACHGTIRVESTLGEGSVFTVWLPVETSPADAME
jgi:signal transduction histidine kinase